MGPWDAVGNFIVSFIEAEKKAKRTEAWLSLIFQMVLSALIAFLFAGGTAMTASKSFAFGCGAGMVSAAVVLAYFFRRSPLTRGMMLVLPQAEANTEINTDLQVIQK